MVIVFLLVMLAVVLALFSITRVEVDKIARHHYRQRESFFIAHPIQPGDIVFLGDSLTAGANWSEIFPGLPTKNRGINADTTQGLLGRLTCITEGKPAAIFILIGTNDLPWFVYRHDEMILGSYLDILEKIKRDTPETKVFVQSLLPRAQSYAKRIRQFNPRLKEYAESMGYTFIDLFPHFATPKGELRPEFNNDHIHLLGPGYALWKEILTPYIDQFKVHSLDK
jgi:lysophospholipase L1-like esterase